MPLIFGILLLTRLVESIGAYSRWALAFIVGTTAGLSSCSISRAAPHGQIAGTLIPLVALHDGSLSFGGTLGNIVIVFGTLCGLIYFFFSKEHTGVFGAASRLGIWVLMVSFGASFGFTVMGRIALLVGRMEYLLHDWLKIIAG
ncbi:MAG: hypothetical protein M5R36_06415 [Deltaproteobacteria bacterium]|nr:hypothetical protein [Deltaproteobacteria bacterium]